MEEKQVNNSTKPFIQGCTNFILKGVVVYLVGCTYCINIGKVTQVE